MGKFAIGCLALMVLGVALLAVALYRFANSATFENYIYAFETIADLFD